MRLAHGHHEGVELGEERGIGGQVGLDEAPRLLVGRRGGQEPMTGEDAPRVRVGHEHGPVRRVEKDGVGGLRPESRDGEQLAPQGAQGRRAQPGEASAEPLHQPA
jgi:hypothetical protein